MLLAVDVGNSHTVLGLYDGDTLVDPWRIRTEPRTADELGLLLRQLVGARKVGSVALCTVVPGAVAAFVAATPRWLGAPTRVYGEGGAFGMPVAVDRPAELGPDRVVNALAARRLVSPPFLVIDLGTATTFDAVDASGTFVGGAIAPGFGIAADALSSRTARLPRIDALAPPAAIGRNTVDAMRAGLWLGYVGLVDHLARRIKAELGGVVPCLATGGLAPSLGPACAEIDRVEPHLTLEGLRAWIGSATPPQATE